jgi:hypothetical protein
MSLGRVQLLLLSGLAEAPRLPPHEQEALFRRPPEGSVSGRWDVYTSGYLARLVEALENDYPAVRRILGSKRFWELTERYLKDFPPRSYDVGRVGERLAVFLGTDGLIESLPFLGDLARLEWQIAESFVAPDSEPLRWTDLQRMAPDEVADLPLSLRPGVALLRSPWPLLDLWKCKDRETEEISVRVEGRPPSRVLVSREEGEVRCRDVGETDARFIEAVRWGGSLVDVQAGLGASASLERLIACFRRWVDEGVFRDPEGRICR